MQDTSSVLDWTIQASSDTSHPNRRAFEGVLTFVDIPSDTKPTGARGHRVVLSKKAAEAAIPGLIGMGVNYSSSWDSHNARQKIGVITRARLDGNRLLVSGFIYARDFPEFIEQCSKPDAPKLGMSYELADAHVMDMRDSVWTLNRVTFTGATILHREKGAYKSTTFELTSAQSANKEVAA